MEYTYRTHEEILNSLPQDVARHIRQTSEAIDRCKEQGHTELVRQYKDGERGYIIALRDCGFIGTVDMRRLIVRYVQR